MLGLAMIGILVAFVVFLLAGFGAAASGNYQPLLILAGIVIVWGALDWLFTSGSELSMWIWRIIFVGLALAAAVFACNWLFHLF